MTEQFTAAEEAILAPYVSNTDQSVFVVQNLPEEVVAVLFAYYSRSKESLRRNLIKLIQDRDITLDAGRRVESPGEAQLGSAREKAKQFHEKWVVGYGHASVAEHAVAHIAIEDVSILVSKAIEDNRIASYTEKSTRYVVFDLEKYYKADELNHTDYSDAYHGIVRLLMKSYAELTAPVIEKVKGQVPQREGQTALAYNAACRAKACDILRYLLPAATFTNIGLTINGRSLEHMITKLLSHPLEEARDYGRAIKKEAERLMPTLLKYANYNQYLDETNAAMRGIADEVISPPPAAPPPAAAGGENSVTLVSYDPQAEDRLVMAILYEHVQTDAHQVEACVRHMTGEQKERVIDEYLKRRGQWDLPLRALEHIYYTFDILVDYGAFRDIQRHRMATQTNQLLVDTNGYEIPPEIIEYGYRDSFVDLMERASVAYRKIASDFPVAAQYVLPLAYRKRVLITWNLRSLHHFVGLRSAKQGHTSYRNIAQQIFREIERVHPLLARYVRVDLADYTLARL
jgi:thymidylate synthase ThyX